MTECGLRRTSSLFTNCKNNTHYDVRANDDICKKWRRDRDETPAKSILLNLWAIKTDRYQSGMAFFGEMNWFLWLDKRRLHCCIIVPCITFVSEWVPLEFSWMYHFTNTSFGLTVFGGLFIWFQTSKSIKLTNLHISAMFDLSNI